MDYDQDYLDCSDDDDDGLMYHSSYLQSSDSEDSEYDAAILKSRALTGGPGEDDFEKEMAAELSQTMSLLTAPLVNSSSKPGKSSDVKKVTFAETNTEESEFYDEVYFDSDSSGEGESANGTRKASRSKHRILSNDELFYDPEMDNRDQAWVDNKRRSYQVKKKSFHSRKVSDPSSDKTKTQPLPQSDAVLNCPACLTTLCLDCQRHQIYNNQYRAMFVFHCKIDFTERLKFPKREKKNNYMKNKKNKAKQRMKMTQSNTHDKVMNIDKNVDLDIIKQDPRISEHNLSMNDESSATIKVANATDSTSPASTNIKNKTDVCFATGSDKTKADDVLSQTIKETQNMIKNNENDSVTQDCNSSNSPKNCTNEESVDRMDPFMSMETVKVDDNQVTGSEDNEEYFNSVSCDICTTKVAVYDKDEVYHFFNIVTSY